MTACCTQPVYSPLVGMVKLWQRDFANVIKAGSHFVSFNQKECFLNGSLTQSGGYP